MGHPSSSACSGGIRGRGTSSRGAWGEDTSGGGDASTGGDITSGESACRGTAGTASGDAGGDASPAGCGSSGPVSPRCGQGLRRPWEGPCSRAGGGAAPRRPVSAAPRLDPEAPLLDSLLGFQSVGGAAAAPRRRALYRRSRSRLASSSGSPMVLSAFQHDIGVGRGEGADLGLKGRPGPPDEEHPVALGQHLRSRDRYAAQVVPDHLLCRRRRNRAAPHTSIIPRYTVGEQRTYIYVCWSVVV